jgi:predicted permease
MALACLVLLAACANLASLLAARAADRHRELAIRLSIGAGRGRIVRQLLAESALLALLGGAVGCGVAAVLLRLLSQWRAPLDFPVYFDVNPDAGVFAFALAAALVTGLLFSIAPARQALGADLDQVLKGAPAGGMELRRTRRGSGPRPPRRWAMRDVLLAAQVILCCVLVSACLVALRGLARTLSMPLGFEPRGVAVASIDLGLAGYDAQRCEVFQRRALEAASRLPGVVAAGYGNSLPLSIDQSNKIVFRAETTDFRLTQGKNASSYQVSPGYLRALGARLLAGRDFTWHDEVRSPPVAIVNLTFARQVFGTSTAVGRRFRAGRGPLIEVVGLLGDGKYVSLTEDPRPAFFRPILQDPNGTSVLVVRSTLPAGEMALELRQAIAGLDPRLPVYGLGSLWQMLGFALFPARAASVALGAFGLLAIMLAATGIYGLASYAVSRRTREIGIRVAVGARPAQVLAFILGRTALLLGVGSAIGLALGFAVRSVLASVVYLASPYDPLVLVATALIMVGVGVAAAGGPARRALAIDPVGALRRE